MSETVDIIVQSGGKFFNKGAYGCIFNPPLVCAGSKKIRGDSSKLGKLTEISDLKNEINVAKVLGQFPDSKKYLVLPEMNTLCKPAADALTKEPEVDKCEPLKKYGIDNMMQFELEYGGRTLKYRLQKMKEDNKIKNIPFFDFMRQMLEIGTFMAIHGCIHNDIHSNNIVLMGYKILFYPRLIDFGRSYMYNNIDKNTVDELSSVYYNPRLRQIPPEITLHHAILHDITLDKALQDILKEKPSLAQAERVLGLSRIKQITNLKDFWETSKSIQGGDWVNFYRLYWPKVDAWAIGVNLLGTLQPLLMNKDFVESKEWIQKQGLVKEVIRGLVQTDPRARLDSVNALSIYDPMNALLSEPSGKAWLKTPQA